MTRSPAVPGVDILLVSLGSTAGLRASDDEFAGALRRAGASVQVARAAPQGQVRTFALTDLRWARAARAAAREGIAAHAPRAIVYSTTTAALLWPAPGAIRYDAPASATRPGRHGVWQRPLERRRLREAPLLIPTAPGTLEETAEPARRGGRRADPRRAVGPRRALGGARLRGDHLRRRPAEEGPRTGAGRVVRRSPRGRDARRRRPRPRPAAGPAAGRRGRRGRWTARPTGRCCAARRCSSPHRGARTTASPSSRRSPTAACS